MKEDAEEEALRIRTEAEQDAFRVRTDAEQHAVRLNRQAEEAAVQLRSEAAEDAHRLRAEAADDAARLRGEAQREHDEMVGNAQTETRTMVENARAERQDAQRVASAVEQTVTAKRAELEDYLVAVTSLAESTARARVTAVLDGYRAEVDRLVAAREQTSAALRQLRRSLELAAAGLGEEVDLTDTGQSAEEHRPRPPSLDEDVVEAAVSQALASVTSPLDKKPGQVE
jgi:vacuolar-type H+-ATPase subunit E/Vma4